MPGPEWRLVRYRGSFAAYCREGDKPVRRSLGTADRALADARFAAFLAELKRESAPGANLTLGDILDGYGRHFPENSYPAQRAKLIRAAIAKVRQPDLLSIRPQHLTREDCRAYAEARFRQGIKPGTVITNLVVLRAACSWAVKERWLDRAPHIEIPKKPDPKDRWLSAEEARALIAATTAPHIRLFVTLALHTAARTAAILDLEWHQVNERFIDFNPPGRARTRKGRAVVPMNADLWQALSAARAGAMTGYVIEWAGERVHSIKTGFRAAVRTARLPGVTPHTLRHTAATWMVQAGVPIPKVANYLGHKDSRTTERVYGHHAPDYLREASAAIVARLAMPCLPGSIEPVSGERGVKTSRKTPGHFPKSA